MKNKNGYTVVELIVVIAVVGIFGLVAINRASYAFSDKEEAVKQLEIQRTKLIEKAALKYAEDNKETLFSESSTTYIRVVDLIENYYLFTTVNQDSENEGNKKIQLSIKDDKIEVHLEK